MTPAAARPIHEILEPDHRRLDKLRQVVVNSTIHSGHPAYAVWAHIADLRAERGQ